jgi:hypothetical protein
MSSVADYIRGISWSKVIDVFPATYGLSVALDGFYRNKDVFFESNTYYQKTSLVLTTIFLYHLGFEFASALHTLGFKMANALVKTMYASESKIIDAVQNELDQSGSILAFGGSHQDEILLSSEECTQDEILLPPEDF